MLGAEVLRPLEGGRGQPPRRHGEEGRVDLGHEHERTQVRARAREVDETPWPAHRLGDCRRAALRRSGLLRLLGQHLPLADGRGRAPRPAQPTGPGRAGRGHQRRHRPWHAGEDMDAPLPAHARRRPGTPPAGHVAEQFDAADFAAHDVVVALDAGPPRRAAGTAPTGRPNRAARGEIVLLRAFDPQLRPGDDPDVADPYYGGGRLRRGARAGRAQLRGAARRGRAGGAGRGRHRRRSAGRTSPLLVALHERLDAVEAGRVPGAEGAASCRPSRASPTPPRRGRPARAMRNLVLRLRRVGRDVDVLRRTRRCSRSPASSAFSSVHVAG